MKHYIKILSLVFGMMMITKLFAQPTTSGYYFAVKNQIIVGNTYQFDVYMYNTGNSPVNFLVPQMAFEINKNFRNGGNLGWTSTAGNVTYPLSSSTQPHSILATGLPPEYLNINTVKPNVIQFTTFNDVVRINPNPDASGDYILAAGSNILLMRIKLVNSVNFSTTAKPQIKFKFTIPGRTGKYNESTTRVLQNSYYIIFGYATTTSALYNTDQLIVPEVGYTKPDAPTNPAIIHQSGENNPIASFTLVSKANGFYTGNYDSSATISKYIVKLYKDGAFSRFDTGIHTPGVGSPHIDLRSLDPGNYQFQVAAVNIADTSDFSPLSSNYLVSVAFNDTLTITSNIANSVTVPPLVLNTPLIYHSGDTESIAINPVRGYKIDSITADGVNLNSLPGNSEVSYTYLNNRYIVHISNFSRNYRIHIYTSPLTPYNINILTNHSSGIFVSDSSLQPVTNPQLGNNSYYQGENAFIKILHNGGYQIDSVLIDNVNGNNVNNSSIVSSRSDSIAQVNLLNINNAHAINVFTSSSDTLSLNSNIDVAFTSNLNHGNNFVIRGSNPSFTITRNIGYYVDSIIFDGKNITGIASTNINGTIVTFANNQYTITNHRPYHTIYVRARLKKFRIDAQPPNNGNLTIFANNYPIRTADSVKEGDSVVFNFTPLTHYKFSSYSLNGGITNITTPTTRVAVYVTQAISFSVAFSPVSYGVFAEVIGGNGTITPAHQTVVYGSSGANFTINPLSSYQVSSVMIKVGANGTFTAFTASQLQSLNAGVNATIPNITDTTTIQIQFNYIPAQTPVITIQPTNQNITFPNNAHFTVVANATDAGNLTYQWFKIDKGATTGNPIAGQTTNIYNVAITDISLNQTKYYVEITNSISHGGGPVQTSRLLSNTVALNVYAKPIKPSVGNPSRSPQGTVTENNSVTYDVSASTNDGGTLSYHWQYKLDGSNTWSNYGNYASTSSFTIDEVKSDYDDAVFRVIVINTINGVKDSATSGENKLVILTIGEIAGAVIGTTIGVVVIGGGIAGGIYFGPTIVAAYNGGGVAFTSADGGLILTGNVGSLPSGASSASAVEAATSFYFNEGYEAAVTQTLLQNAANLAASGTTVAADGTLAIPAFGTTGAISSTVAGSSGTGGLVGTVLIGPTGATIPLTTFLGIDVAATTTLGATGTTIGTAAGAGAEAALGAAAAAVNAANAASLLGLGSTAAVTAAEAAIAAGNAAIITGAEIAASAVPLAATLAAEVTAAGTAAITTGSAVLGGVTVSAAGTIGLGGLTLTLSPVAAAAATAGVFAVDGLIGAGVATSTIGAASALAAGAVSSAAIASGVATSAVAITGAISLTLGETVFVTFVAVGGIGAVVLAAVGGGIYAGVVALNKDKTTGLDSPGITLQPQNFSQKVGGKAAFIVRARVSDGGTLSYQWQSRTNNAGTWTDLTNINGATGARDSNYTTGQLNIQDNARQFQVIITNSKDGKSVPRISNTVILNVTSSNKFIINTVAGIGGTITPSAEYTPNSDVSIRYTPDYGFTYDKLFVDGSTIDAAAFYPYYKTAPPYIDYHINNITANHNVQVTFKPVILTIKVYITNNVGGIKAYIIRAPLGTTVRIPFSAKILDSGFNFNYVSIINDTGVFFTSRDSFSGVTFTPKDTSTLVVVNYTIKKVPLTILINDSVFLKTTLLYNLGKIRVPVGSIPGYTVKGLKINVKGINLNSGNQIDSTQYYTFPEFKDSTTVNIITEGKVYKRNVRRYLDTVKIQDTTYNLRYPNKLIIKTASELPFLILTKVFQNGTYYNDSVKTFTIGNTPDSSILALAYSYNKVLIVNNIYINGVLKTTLNRPVAIYGLSYRQRFALSDSFTLQKVTLNSDTSFNLYRDSLTGYTIQNVTGQMVFNFYYQTNANLKSIYVYSRYTAVDSSILTSNVFVVGIGGNIRIPYSSTNAKYSLNSVTIGGRTSRNYVNDSIGGYTFKNVQTDSTLNLAYSLRKYNLTIQVRSLLQNGSYSSYDTTISVYYGSNYRFQYRDSTGYSIDSVSVNNGRFNYFPDSLTGYTFYNISRNDTLYVRAIQSSYLIVTSANVDSVVSKTQNVRYDNSATVNFIANTNKYNIEKIFVDSIPLASTNITSYTFNNVNRNHTVKVLVNFKQLRYTTQEDANSFISTGGYGIYGTNFTVNFGAFGGYVIDSLIVYRGGTFTYYKRPSFSSLNLVLNDSTSIRIKSIPLYNVSVTVPEGVFFNVNNIYNINTNTAIKNIDSTLVVDPNYRVTSLSYPKGDSIQFNFGTLNNQYRLDSVIVDTTRLNSQQISERRSSYNNLNKNIAIKLFSSQLIRYDTFLITTNYRLNGNIIDSIKKQVISRDSIRVTFNAKLGTYISQVSINNQNVDSLSGYTFKNITSNNVINVQLTNYTYRIRVLANRAGVISFDSTVKYGDSLLVNFRVQSSYKLDSVLKDTVNLGAINKYQLDSIKSAYTFVVYASEKTYRINTNATIGGVISNDATVRYGDSLRINFSAKLGYKFDSVIVQGLKVDSSSTILLKNIDTAYTVSAYFSALSYPIIVTKIGNGTVIIPKNPIIIRDSLNIIFRADLNNIIDSVIINNVQVNSDSVYLLTNASDTQEIKVVFITRTANKFYIKSSRNVGGTIDPYGNKLVDSGANQTYTINPNNRYIIDSVFVNQRNIGPVTTYTFNSVTGDSNIRIVFKAKKIKKTLNISAFIEGYINGPRSMRSVLSNAQEAGCISCPSNRTYADSITLNLVNANGNIIFATIGLLKTNGEASFALDTNINNDNYYILLKHRSTINTWSKSLINFSDSTTFYDFSNKDSAAYGNNLKYVELGRVFAIYSGHVHSTDPTIDIDDLTLIQTDFRNYESGYVFTDLNGNAIVDVDDLQIFKSNFINYISSISPFDEN